MPDYTRSDTDCTVRIKISTAREGDKGEPEEIDRALSETIANIKRLLESQ